MKTLLIASLLLAMPCASYAAEMVFRVIYHDQEFKDFLPTMEQKALPVGLDEWVCSSQIDKQTDPRLLVGHLNCMHVGTPDMISGLITCVTPDSAVNNKSFEMLQARKFFLLSDKKHKGTTVLVSCKF